MCVQVDEIEAEQHPLLSAHAQHAVVQGGGRRSTEQYESVQPCASVIRQDNQTGNQREGAESDSEP